LLSIYQMRASMTTLKLTPTATSHSSDAALVEMFSNPAALPSGGFGGPFTYAGGSDGVLFRGWHFPPLRAYQIPVPHCCPHLKFWSPESPESLKF
jgi:hypothetical protein